MPRIRAKPNKRDGALVAQKLRELGHKHFSEDFPNPMRAGCPSKADIKDLADNPVHAKESALGHISFCSPCYRDYSHFLRAVKRKRHSKCL